MLSTDQSKAFAKALKLSKKSIANRKYTTTDTLCRVLCRKAEEVYLFVHRKNPAENDVTINAYQLRPVLASILCIVTFACN